MGLFSMGMGAFQVIFLVMFVLVFAVFIANFARGLRQKQKDDQSPRLTVPVTVVAKRTNVTVHHHDQQQMHYNTTSTTYYATFEVESGDRMELRVPSSEYGLLVEGDQWSLTFQGSRFLGFQRG